MQRNDYDITGSIPTTQAPAVGREVVRLYHQCYPHASSAPLERAFADVERMYTGRYPDYEPCETEYHDIQHVLDVTLAMARLLDGYERSRKEEAVPIDERLFQLGTICALYHDMGYIRRTSDKRHLNGAEYTLVHVTRGGRFLRDYLPTIGMEEFAEVAGALLHFTGYERPVASIRVPAPVYRLIGSLLGSADIIAQMSDRCYLEKCRDRLYAEFVAGGITRKKTEQGEEVVFASPEDLLRKTPGFFRGAEKRLHDDLGDAYQFAESHFRGPNLYMEAVKQNIRFVEKASADPEIVLRRTPPTTCTKE